MHDRLDGMRPEGTCECFSVRQVSCYEDRIRYGFTVTRLEVVVDNRFIPMAFQLLNDMASDVSSSSGDKNGRNMRGLSIQRNTNDRKIIRA